MWESKNSRALSESLSLRAVASLARLANGLWSAASTKPTPAAKTASATLRPVVRINVDVVFSEIASPESGRSLSLAGDPEDDRDVGIVEPHLHAGFVERRGEPIAADLHILQRDIDLAGIEVDPRVARGGKNAAPVGVGACDRGLHKRRIGDRAGDRRGGGIAQSAMHFHGYELSRSFAIAHDLARQRLKGLGERLFK